MNGRSTSFPGSTPTGAAERGVGQDPGYDEELMVCPYMKRHRQFVGVDTYRRFR